MKIIDTRDGRVLEGTLVAILPAGEPLSMDQMREYYKTRPGEPHYRVMAAPCTKARFVLQRGEQEEGHYYVVPRYEHYKVDDASALQPA